MDDVIRFGLKLPYLQILSLYLGFLCQINSEYQMLTLSDISVKNYDQINVSIVFKLMTLSDPLYNRDLCKNDCIFIS